MSIKPSRHRRARPLAAAADTPDPRLVRGVRHALLFGIALLLVWPAARGYSQWLGWGPLWLLGMPLASWWALHRFRMPRPRLVARLRTWRRPRPQARRLPMRGPAPLHRRVA
ncbi:hypothetical protein [Stenotrophomonas sp. MMGLT7]|uniref:hypothetical protein n=1 Tax=Stenotrophomonas sp. MMGLT7 TaxID=2901227 RepID=UPI001E59F272|nr:hypothetical protein [Stenotrophomonas sp. MMGLT7]MCD7098341.1 hypothetical protein [Stenotrophomonas sp. MMGLT7]